MRVVTALSVSAVLFLAGCASSKSATGPVNAVPASTSADQAAIATAIDASTAPFVASRRSKKFYPASCHTVTLIKPADRVGFSSMNDAEKAGFSKDVYSTDCTY